MSAAKPTPSDLVSVIAHLERECAKAPENDQGRQVVERVNAFLAAEVRRQQWHADLRKREAAEAVALDLLSALTQLCFVIRTTHGYAGDLVKACEGAEAVIERAMACEGAEALIEKTGGAS